MPIVRPIVDPVVDPAVIPVVNWRARGDLNARPLAPQASALSPELRAHLGTAFSTRHSAFSFPTTPLCPSLPLYLSLDLSLNLLLILPLYLL